jgi:nicotinamidase-related amidase
MRLRDEAPILICVDIQTGFLDEESWGGNRNNKSAELVCSKIIEKWRDAGLDIIHVRHSSADPLSKLHKDSEGFAFNPLAQPKSDELIITKSVNSCFIGTNLKDVIDSKNCKTLVIVGLTTDHCVSTTTRMAGNYGYETYLISDATATFDKVGVNGEHFGSELMHVTALTSLHGEFCTVMDSSYLLKVF